MSVGRVEGGWDVFCRPFFVYLGGVAPALAARSWISRRTGRSWVAHERKIIGVSSSKPGTPALRTLLTLGTTRMSLVPAMGSRVSLARMTVCPWNPPKAIWPVRPTGRWNEIQLGNPEGPALNPYRGKTSRAAVAMATVFVLGIVVEPGPPVRSTGVARQPANPTSPSARMPAPTQRPMPNKIFMPQVVFDPVSAQALSSLDLRGSLSVATVDA